MNKVFYRNFQVHSIGIDEVTIVNNQRLEEMKQNDEIAINHVQKLTEWQYKVAAGVFVRKTEEMAWVLNNKKEKPSKKDEFYGFGEDAHEEAQQYIVQFNVAVHEKTGSRHGF